MMARIRRWVVYIWHGQVEEDLVLSTGRLEAILRQEDNELQERLSLVNETTYLGDVQRRIVQGLTSQDQAPLVEREEFKRPLRQANVLSFRRAHYLKGGLPHD